MCPNKKPASAGFFIPTFTTYYLSFYAKYILNNDNFTKLVLVDIAGFSVNPDFAASTGCIARKQTIFDLFVVQTCEVLRNMQKLQP